MSLPRLKAGIWVRGQIAICQSQLITAMVAHKGNEDAGSVLLKHNRFAQGCFLYARVTTLDGTLGWMRVAGGEDGSRETEMNCDLYWQKQIAIDRDIWVLEVEDPKGHYQMDGEIVDY